MLDLIPLMWYYLFIMQKEKDPAKIDAERQAEINRLSTFYEIDENGTISFDRACEGELNLLGQYAASFIDGFGGKPKLAEGLVTGDPANWHSLRTTPEGFVEFRERLTVYRQEQMARALGQSVNG
jgi:hypothetical protein